jgi:hypothetical protein
MKEPGGLDWLFGLAFRRLLEEASALLGSQPHGRYSTVQRLYLYTPLAFKQHHH